MLESESSGAHGADDLKRQMKFPVLNERQVVLT